MILILTLVLGIFGFLISNLIRRTFISTTILLTLISILSIIVPGTIFEPITTGFLGLAFFIIVMYAGAMPKNTKLEKRLKSIRKEYSIYGFITITPHILILILDMFNGNIHLEWFGILSYFIMVPLFITSFKVIRRKMQNKTWYKLQKLSYIVYFFIYVHLVMLYTGNNIYIYTALFTLYIGLKSLYHFAYNKSLYKRITTVSLSIIAIILTAYIGTDGDIIQSHSQNIIIMSETSISDGIYVGSAEGYEDHMVEVEVTIENGQITSILLLDDGSSEPRKEYDYSAIAQDIINQILKTQSTEVDSVSGATHTVEGVVNAVGNALNN